MMRIGVVLAALLLAGCSRSEPDRTAAAAQAVNAAALPDDAGPTQVKADELARAFRTDPKNARRRYPGAISVYGRITAIKRGDGFVDATLSWQGRRDTVDVALKEQDVEVPLRKGEIIGAACLVIDAFDTPILLRQCDFIGKLDED